MPILHVLRVFILASKGAPPIRMNKSAGASRHVAATLGRINPSRTIRKADSPRILNAWVSGHNPDHEYRQMLPEFVRSEIPIPQSLRMVTIRPPGHPGLS